ncbi:TonB-dependent receptor domain-containing protein [Phenylobacterium sp.]|uniref:TonB-dependent receptor domain-containing protein n=1 Tax=Phenylobacterium sp. TaxID=1871053 RepID=UPI002E315F85|nr:TonB-dependent receptor [Phenylobacterium sp.]HEX3365019.1 TonB-dependent receptor [Phenylobacterium sp.]
MRSQTFALIAGLASSVALRAQAQAPPQPAQAQTPQPAATAEPGKTKTVEAVTVTATSPDAMHAAIDRRSYGVSSDLAATTGSTSDALRNIPSIAVDPEGNVALRGDTHVTIMLDGKPTGQFNGPGAAQALQAMPASAIERVEVITNPSAEFTPEGSAGIINLISKKVRKPGVTGTMRAVYGDRGRRQLGVSGAYNAGTLAVSADAYARRDPQPAETQDAREVFDGAGHQLTAIQTRNHDFSHFDSWGGRAGADFDADAKTRLSAEARYNVFSIETLFNQQFQGEGQSDPVDERFLELGRGTFARKDAAFDSSLRRVLPGDDHTLNLDLSREQIHEERDGAFNQAFSLPDESAQFFEIRTLNLLNRGQARADYAAPLPTGGRLKAGFDVRADDNRYDTAGVRGAPMAGAEPDLTQTNLFRYRQTVGAAYTTYEQPFGDWAVLGGLRLEEVVRDLDQVTLVQTNHTSYFRAYPSLHAQYKVSDTQQFTASYAQRVQRPNPEDLNVFRIQSDAITFRAGNPDLRPQTTQAFEAAYQYRSGGTYYLATLYYRQNEHGVTDVITPLPNDMFLSSKANLSDSKAAGLELVANGHLTPSLTYNASANLYWNQIDAQGQGLQQLADFAARRSATVLGGRATLSWRATRDDTFQANANLLPKQLVPQGHVEAVLMTYIGYRHRFRDDLFGVVTINDPFTAVRATQVIETPLLRDRKVQDIHLRGVFFGLTRTFGGGGKRPAAPGLDLTQP